MKRITLLVAVPGFAGTDLTGTWCVSMSEASSESNFPAPGTISEVPEYAIEIEYQEEMQYGLLFYGYVDVSSSETTYFSGVLDGKNISMTHWDSVTRGKLKQKGKKPLEIHFINNAFDAKYRSGKTAIGVAVQGDCP